MYTKARILAQIALVARHEWLKQLFNFPTALSGSLSRRALSASLAARVETLKPTPLTPLHCTRVPSHRTPFLSLHRQLSLGSCSCLCLGHVRYLFMAACTSSGKQSMRRSIRVRVCVLEVSVAVRLFIPTNLGFVGCPVQRKLPVLFFPGSCFVSIQGCMRSKQYAVHMQFKRFFCYGLWAVASFGCADKPAEKYCWLICCERKILFRLKKQAEKDGL
jgi:hypothetical protein